MSHQMIGDLEQRQNSALAQSEMGDEAIDQQAAVHVDNDANGDEEKGSLLPQDDSQMKGKSPVVNSAASGGSYLSSPALLRELVVSLCVFWFGWYVPKFLRRRYGVNQRRIPYQVLAKSGDVVLDPSLNHPYVGLDDVVVTSEMLIATCVWMPLVVICASGFFFNRTSAAAAAGGSAIGRWVESHTGVCVLLVAVGLSEFTTQTVKARVGRLRPNFYGMCGFDLDALECTASAKRQLEARQSFPSGHSSLSVAGMTVVALFFLGRAGIGRIREKRKEVDCTSVGSNFSLGRRQVLSFASVIFPLAYATYVATSRLIDDWHHVSDVVAGCVIGFVSAGFAYHLFFPFVMSDLAGIPHRLLCGSAYRV